jgi:hypothetical protein
MISDAQKSVLQHLRDGARIKPNEDRSQWTCILPNGMGCRIRKATMNSLYYGKLIEQDQNDPKYVYVISEHGKAVLAAAG